MNIKINIEKQKLYLKKEPHEGPYIVSDSINYLQCTFKFSDDWTDFDKTATFKDDIGNAYSILLENDKCTVPYEVLSGNKFKVSVFGSKDGVRITTNEVVVPIVPSGYVEGKTPSKPPKTAYELILDKLRQIGTLLRLQTNNKETLVEAINEVKDDIDTRNALYDNYGITDIQPSDASLFIFTELEDGTYAVAAKDKESISGDIVIPYEHNGKKVTAINNANNWECFRDCKGITSIVFPNTITLIGTSAFQGCNFTEINIPGSVKKISNYAFFGCAKLDKVVLGEGVEEMGKAVFNACNVITCIEIPSTLSSIYNSDNTNNEGECTFSCSSAVNNVDVYYNGTRKQFDALNVGEYLLNKGTIYCKYVDESEFSKQDDLSKLTTAFLKGMQIKEFILWKGDTFTIKPNTIFIAFPPDKTMEIYKSDGTAVATSAGIIGAVCSEINESDIKFRAATFYQQSGVLGTSDYEASYFYFEEGAYIKYTGSGGYARVLCNVPVVLE